MVLTLPIALAVWMCVGWTVVTLIEVIRSIYCADKMVKAFWSFLWPITLFVCLIGVLVDFLYSHDWWLL